ncbi:unnamed protein product, partial [Hapterophycus canaliculatus]
GDREGDSKGGDTRGRNKGEADSSRRRSADASAGGGRGGGTGAGGGGGGYFLDEELHVYIAALQLFPIKLNFSFIKNADVKDLFRLLDQREQEKMEWELLEGRVDGRTKVPALSLSHGL